MSDEKIVVEKKPAYPVSKRLDAYLDHYNRKIEILYFMTTIFWICWIDCNDANTYYLCG
jgi:hypothetical protein